MNIQLKEMNFFNVVPMIDDFYNVLSTNRARLEPWFWWASSKVTPNKFKYALFMLLYLANTKRRKIAHKFDHKQIYDEQFIINVDGEFGGIIGMDNIDTVNKNAELWGWLSKGHKAFIVADESLKILENYCIKEKNLESLYAKTQASNRAVKIAAQRNGFSIKSIEYGIPISKRNPKIADIITWEKQLVR